MVGINQMIKIIYEDNHLLVVEKPINIPVQSDSSKDTDLLTLLKNYLKKMYNKPGDAYLGLVHRLDRPVGGVMVFAKTSKCASRLSEQIRNGGFKKVYYAVVEGNIFENGLLKDKLLKDECINTVKVDNNGKDAELYFERIDYKDSLSLVKINLKTGRSHQIRVQFSSRGYPLYGDHRYNKNCKKNSQIALYAQSVSFNHPITKEKVTYSLPLPSRYPFNIFK
jgi:23S rRNA pseudouridine1911/1915/1917 synthase